MPEQHCGQNQPEQREYPNPTRKSNTCCHVYPAQVCRVKKQAGALLF